MKKTFLTFIILSIFSCSKSYHRAPIQNREVLAPVETLVEVEQREAPWQAWDNQNYGSYELSNAESESLNASFDTAISYYKQALRVSNNPKVIDQARLRLIGTMLKLGKSQEALLEISKYTKARGIKPKELRKDFALFAAWAYLEQRKINQSLAWFNVASRTIDKNSVIREKSIKGVKSFLKTFNNQELQKANSKWPANTLMSTLIKEERTARLTSSPSQNYSLAKFFNAGYYRGASTSQQSLTSTTDGSSNIRKLNTNDISIGVLLPLTGKFSIHANKVKEGIELATLNQNIRVEFADTRADASVATQEYENLVNNNVSVVLGPLLVATSEAVADQSKVLGIPIISFTKKEGLTDIGDTVFRLGATSSNQVQELVNFAVDRLGVSRFGVMFPSSNVASDFVAQFKNAIQNEPVTLVAEEFYEDSKDAISAAVQRIIYKEPQAIFLPDRLEYCANAIEQIKAAGLENTYFFGPALWSDPIAVRGYGQVLDGSFYVSLFNEDSLAQNVQSFIQSYREKYKHDPDLLAAQSFDATSYVLNALRANTTSEMSLLDAFRSYPVFDGVTGRLSLSSNGEIYRNLAIMRVDKGEPVQLQSN